MYNQHDHFFIADNTLVLLTRPHLTSQVMAAEQRKLLGKLVGNLAPKTCIIDHFV